MKKACTCRLFSVLFVHRACIQTSQTPLKCLIFRFTMLNFLEMRKHSCKNYPVFRHSAGLKTHPKAKCNRFAKIAKTCCEKPKFAAFEPCVQTLCRFFAPTYLKPGANIKCRSHSAANVAGFHAVTSQINLCMRYAGAEFLPLIKLRNHPRCKQHSISL